MCYRQKKKLDFKDNIIKEIYCSWCSKGSYFHALFGNCTVEMGSYSSKTMCHLLGQVLNLLGSILTILPTCPNSDTLLCYSNTKILTVWGGIQE